MYNNDCNINKSFVDRRKDIRKEKSSNQIEKVLQNGSKNGSTSVGSGEPKLSKTELKFISFIRQGYISRETLAVVGNCTTKNVDKYLTKLRKKGIIGINNELVAQWGGTMLPQGGGSPMQVHSPQGGARYMRVHGQQLWIEILWSDQRYQPGHDKPIFIDGQRVLTHDKVVEVYLSKEFIGREVNDATEKSLDFIYRFIGRLQNDLKIILIKNRVENIKIVKQHIGYVGDPLAKDVVISGKKFHVLGAKGELRLIIDNSDKHPEIEAIKAGKCTEDMTELQRHYQDIIEHKPPTITELLDAQVKIEKDNQITSENLREISSALRLIIAPPNQKETLIIRTQEWDIMYG